VLNYEKIGFFLDLVIEWMVAGNNLTRKNCTSLKNTEAAIAKEATDQIHFYILKRERYDSDTFTFGG